MKGNPLKTQMYFCEYNYLPSSRLENFIFHTTFLSGKTGFDDTDNRKWEQYQPSYFPENWLITETVSNILL